MVDGGTDALVFGTETGLGTPVEDAVSLRAAVRAHGARPVLVCLGFGAARVIENFRYSISIRERRAIPL